MKILVDRLDSLFWHSNMVIVRVMRIPGPVFNGVIPGVLDPSPR